MVGRALALRYQHRDGAGGDNEIRTRDLLLAKQALYQLSYVPACSQYGGLGQTRTADLTLIRRAL
jgi:hypothetical protein